MQFKPPNYQAQVREQSTNTWKTRLLRADSEEEAQRMLEEHNLIIKEDSIESYDFENKWLKDARDETATAIAQIEAGESYTWRNSLWGKLKDHLQDLFHGKCAYCDASFTSVSFGDVDHYRPKGAVADEDGKVVNVTDANGNLVPHPGYYWLAYDPQNYLPTCEKCNRPPAKKDRFPIDGERAHSPTDDLGEETPKLINPYDDRFSEHLAYGPTTDKAPGYALARDARGQVSINVYNLNRKDLPRDRQMQQGHARNDYLVAYLAFLSSPSDDRSQLDELLGHYEAGEVPFRLAAEAEIDAFAKKKGLESPFEPQTGETLDEDL